MPIMFARNFMKFSQEKLGTKDADMNVVVIAKLLAERSHLALEAVALVISSEHDAPFSFQMSRGLALPGQTGCGEQGARDAEHRVRTQGISVRTV